MIAMNSVDASRSPSPPHVSSAAAASAEGQWTLIGDSPAMRDVQHSINLVSGNDINVLITGETGTGKELVARAIRDRGDRATEPFLTLNCAAIPETLLESELFGHERGAFSGADRRRIGKFEQCDGGTILLDEIGDMPLTLQAKVLRLLQDQSFERVGGDTTLRTNVRLIASTCHDLKAMAAAGQFRPDLYYRLNGFAIHLPPLRERGDDLDTLVHHFVRRHGGRAGRGGVSLAPDAMDRLRRHDWPGNVRELHNTIRQALLRSGNAMLTAEHFPGLPSGGRPQNAGRRPGGFDVTDFLRGHLSNDSDDLYFEIHRELDRVVLHEVLNFTRGNQHLAAKILGIARQTLRTKMRDAGVRVANTVESRPAGP